jgi:CRP-like cAMP-binding protein
MAAKSASEAPESAAGCVRGVSCLALALASAGASSFCWVSFALRYVRRWAEWAMATKHPIINLFSDLPQSFSALLFANAKPVHLAADQVLFVAGDPGHGCYRIENGLLKVSIVSATGGERILAILGPGAIVGELAVLDGLPRSASVVALRDSDRLFASQAKFDDCAKKHPGLYQHLLMLLA